MKQNKEQKYKEELLELIGFAEDSIKRLRERLDDTNYSPEEVKTAAQKIQKEQVIIADLKKSWRSANDVLILTE